MKGLCIGPVVASVCVCVCECARERACQLRCLCGNACDVNALGLCWRQTERAVAWHDSGKREQPTETTMGSEQQVIFLSNLASKILECGLAKSGPEASVSYWSRLIVLFRKTNQISGSNHVIYHILLFPLSRGGTLEFLFLHLLLIWTQFVFVDSPSTFSPSLCEGYSEKLGCTEMLLHCDTHHKLNAPLMFLISW